MQSSIIHGFLEFFIPLYRYIIFFFHKLVYNRQMGNSFYCSQRRGSKITRGQGKRKLLNTQIFGTSGIKSWCKFGLDTSSLVIIFQCARIAQPDIIIEVIKYYSNFFFYFLARGTVSSIFIALASSSHFYTSFDMSINKTE